MSSSLSAPAAQATNNVCQTPECAETAKSILNFIDFNVDPCSDFYQYTCGSWLKNATIPADEYAIGPYVDAVDVIADTLRTILEGEYSDLYENLTYGDDGFQSDDEQEVDKANFEAIQVYYNVCMDTNALEAFGPTPIYPEIMKIQNDLFPVNQTNETYSAEKINQMTDILVFLTRSVRDTLASPSVYSDEKDSSINAIHLAAPALTLGSKQAYEAAQTLQLYNSSLIELVTTIIGDPGCQECGPTRANESQNLGFQLWSKEKVQSAVLNFITIETALANISSTTADSRDPLASYNPVSLTDFQKEHPLIDWESYLKGLAISGASLPENITVASPAYYRGLNQLLSNNSVEMIALQDYFIISYVSEMAYALDSKSRAASNKLTGGLLTGVTTERPRWRTCTDATSEVFDAALGRYYVLRAFGSEEERNKTEVFVNTLHDSWRNRIPATEWLDAETKEKAMEKLNMIKHKVAYPTEAPDVRSPVSISKYFDGLQPNKTSYFDTEVMQKTWKKTLEWKQLGKPVNKDVWLMSPQTVNAYYFPNYNEIAVPAGFLQPIFYDTNFPEYLNYGSVGYVISHEFSHGFDSIGRLYDSQGGLTEWWTNATSEQFVNKSQCFIDQYSKFNITSADGTTYNVDGKLTLSENIADNGGLAASFFAYQNLRPNHTEQEPRLPGLEQLSPEQLFFVNLGRTWCISQTDQINILSIYTDPHSPSPARVNGAVQNSEDFARAFNCSANSPMNPSTKCKLW